MLVEPRDMLKALNQFDFVNLRHLTTRRDRGYINPVSGVGKGERPKYDMRNALIYCVGAFLESNSFIMDEAYNLATEAVDHHLDSIRANMVLWLVVFRGGQGQSEHVFLSSKSKDEGNEVITVLPGVSLPISRERMDEINNKFAIVGIHAANVGEFVNGVIRQLFDPAPTTDASVSVANAVVGYCDAAEDMIRAQYECVAHNIARSIANCVIAQQKSRALPRLDG